MISDGWSDDLDLSFVSAQVRTFKNVEYSDPSSLHASLMFLSQHSQFLHDLFLQVAVQICVSNPRSEANTVLHQPLFLHYTTVESSLCMTSHRAK
jgi:trans-aconitate methyltransferase